MFRFFSCLFGKTPEERNQEEQIQALNKTINKQKEKLKELEENKSNEAFKLEDLREKLSEKEKILKEQGNVEQEIYYEELRKSARRHYAQSNGLKFHEDDNTDGSSEPDPDVLDIDINPYEKERRKREKDKPSNER